MDTENTEGAESTEKKLSEIVIGAAIEVHKELGPGLLESAYTSCLAYELKRNGLSVEQEKTSVGDL